MYAITLLDSTNIVGFCGVIHPDNQDQAEIKYALKRDYWGAGFATEVVRALLDYAKKTFGLNSIIATVAPDNLASQRVLVKSGLILMGKEIDKDGAVDFVYG